MDKHGVTQKEWRRKTQIFIKESVLFAKESLSLYKV